MMFTLALLIIMLVNLSLVFSDRILSENEAASSICNNEELLLLVYILVSRTSRIASSIPSAQIHICRESTIMDMESRNIYME